MVKVKLAPDKLLPKLFFGAFSLIFSIIVLSILISNTIYYPTSVLIIIYTLMMLVFVCITYQMIQLKEPFLNKNYYKVLVGYAVLMFAIQILIGRKLYFDPVFDLEAIYQGAKEWATTGTFGNYSSSTCYKDYFYIFPNNMGGLAFLAVLFKIASVLGIHDTFTVAMVVNGFLTVCTMVLTSLICKDLWGNKHAVFVLVLLLLSPPFYFIAPVFYTDSLTMIYPVAAFYLYLKARQKSGVEKPILYYIAIGLLVAVGMLIKFTVVIVVIAVFIYDLCTKQMKQALIFSICTGLSIVIVLISFSSYIYSNHLNKEKAEQVNMPISYWFSLGFTKDGVFNQGDFSRGLSIKDPDEREKVYNEMTADRIKNLGVLGVIILFDTKSVKAFGDGTFALSDFLDDRPQQAGFLHSFLLYNGSAYLAYRLVCTAVFLVLLILMLFSAYQNLFDRTKTEFTCFIPHLCVFGIMMFLWVWEVKSRYITNFVPMIFICGVGGIDYFLNTVSRVLPKLKQKPVHNKTV